MNGYLTFFFFLLFINHFTSTLLSHLDISNSEICYNKNFFIQDKISYSLDQKELIFSNNNTFSSSMYSKLNLSYNTNIEIKSENQHLEKYEPLDIENSNKTVLFHYEKDLTLKHNVFPSRPKYYARANSDLPNDYFNLNKFDVMFGVYSNYHLEDTKIGRGSFCEVFLGTSIYYINKRIAMKTLFNENIENAKKEIKILQHLTNGTNIIELVDIVKNPKNKIISLVFDYIDTNMGIVDDRMTDFDNRFYLYELLKAVDYAHSKGVIHRDIKREHILIDHNSRTLKLIDWDVSDFYFPNSVYDYNTGALIAKSPEQLLMYKFYDYSVDMWAVGVIFAKMVRK